MFHCCYCTLLSATPFTPRVLPAFDLLPYCSNNFPCFLMLHYIVQGYHQSTNAAVSAACVLLSQVHLYFFSKAWNKLLFPQSSNNHSTMRWQFPSDTTWRYNDRINSSFPSPCCISLAAAFKKLWVRDCLVHPYSTWYCGLWLVCKS